MPLENTPPAIDDTVADALGTDLQAIIDTLEAFNINLTTEDRKTATTVGARRTAFMYSYFENMDDFPKLKPPFMDEAEALGHIQVIKHLMNVKVKATKLLELIDDLSLNSQHFSYQYALEGYATVQRGKEKNVPGADTFYDLLSPNFAQSSTGEDDSEDPAPADGPAPSDDNPTPAEP